MTDGKTQNGTGCISLAFLGIAALLLLGACGNAVADNVGGAIGLGIGGVLTLAAGVVFAGRWGASREAIEPTGIVPPGSAVKESTTTSRPAEGHQPKPPVGHPLEPWLPGTTERIEIVGERYRPASFEVLFKGVPQATSYEGAELDLPAALVADFQNPHDSRAVAVWVGGQHVGFLAREYAAVWAPRVASLAERGEYFEFPARTWASVRRDRTSARVSVWASDPALMRPCNSFPSEPFTVLPRGSAVQVTREEDHMDVLTKYATVEGTPLIATLHNVKEVRPRSTVDAIEVRLDGQRVGILSPTQTANVGPLVQYLEERHRVPVARAVAKGNALKIDVVLYVQKAQEVDESWLEGIGPVASTPSPSEPPSIDD